MKNGHHFEKLKLEFICFYNQNVKTVSAFCSCADLFMSTLTLDMLSRDKAYASYQIHM